MTVWRAWSCRHNQVSEALTLKRPGHLSLVYSFMHAQAGRQPTRSAAGVIKR